MNTLKNQIKAIIFDMDGTIIKTEHIWQEVNLNVLALNGFKTLTPEQVKILKSFSGIGLIQSSTILKKEFNLPGTVEEIKNKKIEIAHQIFSQKVEFIEGFENFHKKLQANNISTGVATNADSKTLSILSQKLNFVKFFGNNFYGVEDVQNKAKPDPALFLHTAKQLDAKPEECVVFEDSIYGFQAAKAAGMRCIAVQNNLNKNLMDQVSGFIKDYNQAEGILKKIIQ